MAYIAPNSTVWIYKGVPLDENYENTYWFSDKATQKAEFDKSYLAATFTAQSYCRASGNAIRVQINPDTIYNCNYMAFRNTGFGNKIFYAFVNEVAYVNNLTAEVRFTIDVMQTYLRDIIFLPSYIEREHSATDEIGDSITAEPNVASGLNINGVYNDLYPSGERGAYTVLVTAHDFLNPNKEMYVYSSTRFSNVRGAVIAGQANVLRGEADGVSYVDEITKAVNEYIKTCGIEGILQMYTIPATGFSGRFEIDKPWLAYGYSKLMPPDTPYEARLTKPNKSTSTLGGYKPVNAKLYTYPYYYLNITNSDGTAKEYRYEFFMGGSEAKFNIHSSGIAPDGCLVCVPQYYKNATNVNNWDEGFAYSKFPASSVTSDQMIGYMGANSSKMIANQLSSNLGLVTNLLSNPTSPSNVVNSSIQAANTPLHTFANLWDLRGKPSVIGGLSGDYFNAVNNIPAFQACNVTVNASVAKQYDDYFTRFGYAVNEVKFPNFFQNKGRKTFNYVKTVGASITAKEAPAEAVKKIKEIFDSGVTLWLQLGNVGNFGLSNDCIT